MTDAPKRGDSGKVAVQAKDVVIVGANVVSKDLLSINADNGVTITAATDTFTTTHNESKSMLGVSANIGSSVSLNSSSSTLNTTQTATYSGATVVITSGGDSTVTASKVVADKDVSITAGGNVNIMAATNTNTNTNTNTETNTSQSTSHNTSIGLVGGASADQTIFSNTTTDTSVLSVNKGTLPERHHPAGPKQPQQRATQLGYNPGISPLH
ncbi:MAG: hemagglutinin repeat-containing protein [Pseudomonadota bacterium]